MAIKDYQRTDQHFAQNEELAKQRILAIYKNRPYDAPSGAKLDAMASNVVNQGYKYFDTIRRNPDKYVGDYGTVNRGVEPRNSGQSPPRGNPNADPANDPTLGGGGVNLEEKRDYARDARAMYPWLPEPLLQLFVQEWADTGLEEVAWGKVRQSGQYDDFFPGIKREDGSLRMSEQRYLAEMEGYGQTLAKFGIPPQTFKKKFVKLMEHGVDSSEFHRRVSQRFTKIASMSEDIRRYYADNFGTGDISMPALLASELDPGTDPLVYEEQFRIAQIGGTGREMGFEVALQDAERMADFGLTRQAAQEFFGRARGMVPTLSALAKRHNDPDDDFDISEMADALVFQDPRERRRIERLLSQERAAFSTTEGTVVMDERGGLAGLSQR